MRALSKLLIAFIMFAIVDQSLSPFTVAGDSAHRRSHRGYDYRSPSSYAPSFNTYSLPYWQQPSYRSGASNNSAPPHRPDRYGSIAYSRSTGAIGYSYGHYSQADAERSARQNCDATDAEIVGWVKNAYAALAVGDDVSQYGWSWSTCRETAQQEALTYCQERTTNCRIATTLFTGN